MAQARIDIVVNDQSINGLEAKLNKLQAELKETAIGSAEFKRLATEIRGVQTQLDSANASLEKFDIGAAVGNASKIFGGLAAGLAGISVLFADSADSTEELAEAQTKLTAAFGLVQLAEAVATIATVSNTAATAAATAATATRLAVQQQLVDVFEEGVVGEYAFVEALQKQGYAVNLVKDSTLGFDFVLNGNRLTVDKFRKDLIVLKDEMGNNALVFNRATGTINDFNAEIFQANKNASSSLLTFRGLGKAIGGAIKQMAAFVATPVGAAIVALGALAAITEVLRRDFESGLAVSQFGAEVEGLGDIVSSTVGEFQSLTEKVIAYSIIAGDARTTTEQLDEAQKSLEEDLLKTGLAQEDVNNILAAGETAIDNYIVALNDLIKAQVLFELLSQEVKTQIELQTDLTKSAPGFGQTLLNLLSSSQSFFLYNARQLQTTLENQSEALDESEKRYQAFLDQYKKLLEEGGIADLVSLITGGGEDAPAKVTDIANEILKLQRDFVTQTIKSTSEGYDEEEKLAEQSRQNAIDDLNRRREEVRKDATISRAQKKLFLQAAKDEEERIELEYREKIKDIDDRKLKDEQDALKEGTKILQESLQERLDLNQEYNSLEEEQEQIALKKRLLAGEITEAEYEQQLLDTREKFLRREEEQRSEAIVSSREALLKEILKLQDDESEEGIKRRQELQNQVTQTYIEEDKLAREFTNEYAKLENERVEATKEANEEIVEDTKKANEEKAEQFAEYVRAIEDVLVGILEFGITGLESQIEILGIETQSQIERLDKSLEETQKNFDARQKQINQSTVLSAKARENAILQLEEQRAAEEARIAKDKEKLERDSAKKGLKLQSQQAKANLAIGIARAISEAAIGISTATAQAPLTFGASLLLIAPIAASLSAAIASYSAQEKSIDAQVSALGFAEGGFVSGPGSGTSDSVPARLSNGEFVINAASTANNLPLLEEINSTGATNSSMTAVLNELRGEIEALRSQPVKAYVVTSELDEASRTDAYITRRAQL